MTGATDPGAAAGGGRSRSRGGGGGERGGERGGSSSSSSDPRATVRLAPSHTFVTPSLTWESSGVASALSRACASCKTCKEIVSSSPWLLRTLHSIQDAAACNAGSDAKTAVQLRLSLGIAAEEALRERAARLVPVSPSASDQHQHLKPRHLQLFHDAFLVSVFVSAHANWLIMREEDAELSVEPTLHLACNCLSSPSLAYLYSARSMQSKFSKESVLVLQMLTRCLNPGTRGWEPVVASALKTNLSKRVLCRELIVCLTGMHPSVHPACRPTWKERATAERFLLFYLFTEAANADLQACALYLKETCRRMLCDVFASEMPLLSAHDHLSHPCRTLCRPPLSAPHPSFAAAMAAFASAGSAIAAMEGLGEEGGTEETSVLACALRPAFAQAGAQAPHRRWTPGWLGKGSLAFSSEIGCLCYAEGVWAKSFKSNFALLWALYRARGVRLVRADPAQYDALNGMLACNRLCASVPVPDALRLQRLALRTPSASLLTLNEALALLGYDPSKLPKTADPKDVLGITRGIAQALGERCLADVLLFARAAWIASKLVVIRLGTDKANAQCRAVLRRMKRDLPPGGADLVATCESTLPDHCRSLMVCCECARVTNAHVVSGMCDEKKITPFNELGLSQSMVEYGSMFVERKGADTGASLICAKRTSAALRACQTFQEKLERTDVEGGVAVDAETVRSVRRLLCGEVVASSSSSSSDDVGTSKLRRDAKVCMEQRRCSTSCGTFPMLKIPMLGRAVRILGHTYVLCEVCATCVRLTGVHRLGSKLCCLRCDAEMMQAGQPSSSAPSKRRKLASTAAICRYCGNVDPCKSGQRWKEVKSPLDTAGENATLPIPLRKCFYCPVHYRNWMVQAHRVLQTKVILAHISINARPVIQSDTDELQLHAKKAQTASAKRKMRTLSAASATRRG